ncbi:MAG: hypothetical protein NUV94_08185 [Candidatus Acetothermia bacterium]|nr:hypothetical protein [Candidatus Acetothermia bacterium]
MSSPIGRFFVRFVLPRWRLGLGELTWIGLGLVVALRGLFASLEQYLTVVIEEALVADVENALVRHLLALPPRSSRSGRWATSWPGSGATPPWPRPFSLAPWPC